MLAHKVPLAIRGASAPLRQLFFEQLLSRKSPVRGGDPFPFDVTQLRTSASAGRPRARWGNHTMHTVAFKPLERRKVPMNTPAKESQPKNTRTTTNKETLVKRRPGQGERSRTFSPLEAKLTCMLSSRHLSKASSSASAGQRGRGMGMALPREPSQPAAAQCTPRRRRVLEECYRVG